MRHCIFVLTIIFFVSYSCFADSVSKEKAGQTAARFWGLEVVSTKSASPIPEAIELAWTYSGIATKSETDSPLLYAFNRKTGGYVIVSGEDVAHPILGYSDKGSFNPSDIPDGLKGLLEWYAKIIMEARVKKWEATPETLTEWENYTLNSEGTNTQEALLETASWGQDDPYNDLCPIIDGQRCPSGCVATAIAIIMRYHRWPHRGNGHLPSYEYAHGSSTIHIDGHDLGHEYYWDNMPTDDYYPNAKYTKEQASQIAQLLYDIGVMCQMSYGPDGSGSEIKSALLLSEFFGYERCLYHSRADYSTDLWESMIKKEILEKRPVLYNAWGDDGGHALVIDGYRNDYFSCNFGWGRRSGKSASSFYLLSPIDKDNSELIRFYLSQYIVSNIQPNFDNNQSGFPSIAFWNTFPPSSPYWDYSYGKKFYMSTGYLANNSTSVSYVRFLLCDSEGRIIEPISDICEIHISQRGGYSSYKVQCVINKVINEGDKIILAQYNPESGEYLPLVTGRFSQIIFTNKPLSELVSVGYSVREEKPVLYIKMYKDIYWELKDQSGTIISLPDGITFNEDENFVPRTRREEGGSDFVIRWYDLKKGVYYLKIKNFDEEAVVEITI